MIAHSCEPKGDIAVRVSGLRIISTNTRQPIVDDASFELAQGEILGVVGESGSGKTTLGLALLNHCRRGLKIEAGTVIIGGRDILADGPEQLRQLRGQLVCYVPQDPATALNPALRIGTQISECLQPDRRSKEAIFRLLDDVKLPANERFLDAFPHQLSGGQLQRVAIAMAFANRPRLIVMDEPTTGLDVTTQAHVLKTVHQLCIDHHVAALYVSHDIAVIAEIATRTAVVYAGKIVEIGPTEQVLRNSSHPYTRALIRAVPEIDDDRVVTGIAGQAPDPSAKRAACAFAPRCSFSVEPCHHTVPVSVVVGQDHEAACLRATEREAELVRPSAIPPVQETFRKTILGAADLRAFHGKAEILHGLSFDITSGDCVGVVGESGSGKTTLARCIAGLHPSIQGAMYYIGQPLPAGAGQRSKDIRRRIQYVFQNPYSSLNPRRSVGDSIAVALAQFGGNPSAQSRSQVLSALDLVSLPSRMADRLPHEMSGGQRQRAAIARALIASPDLLVCDEVTSALDVSVQATIMELLASLQRERGLTILFVSHNLAVVRSIAQKIFVMQKGEIVEIGDTRQILQAPRSEVTQRLLRDAPRFSRGAAQTASSDISVPA